MKVRSYRKTGDSTKIDTDTLSNADSILRDTNNTPITATTLEESIQEFANLWIPPLGNWVTIQENASKINENTWGLTGQNFGDNDVHIVYKGNLNYFSVTLGSKKDPLLTINRYTWDNVVGSAQCIYFTYMKKLDGLWVCALLDFLEYKFGTGNSIPFAKIIKIPYTQPTNFTVQNLTTTASNIQSSERYMKILRVNTSTVEKFLFVSALGDTALVYGATTSSINDTISINFRTTTNQQQCFQWCLDTYNGGLWCATVENKLRGISILSLEKDLAWNEFTVSLDTNENIISMTIDDQANFYFLTSAADGVHLKYQRGIPFTGSSYFIQEEIMLMNCGVYPAYEVTSAGSGTPKTMTNGQQTIWENILEPAIPIQLYFINGLLYLVNAQGGVLVGNFHREASGTGLNVTSTTQQELGGNLWVSSRHFLIDPELYTTSIKFNLTVLGNCMLILDIVDMLTNTTIVTGVSYTYVGEYASAT